MNALPRLLFVAENITLAQVTRLAALASGLDENFYEIHFACSAFDDLIFRGLSFRKHFIHTISKEELLSGVKKGKWLYSEEVLTKYVQEDLKLIGSVRPDLIIGDFRLSLTVSAAMCGIPYINLINAYWSPYYNRGEYPMPENPLTRFLGLSLTSLFYPLARPLVFDHFARPVNRLRKRHGLQEIGSLEEVLTYGDHVVYPDIPEMIPLSLLPPRHTFIGPVMWSPRVSGSFNVPGPLPIIYVTLGSSGNIDKLETVLAALKELPVTAMVATAGRTTVRNKASNIHIYDFLPGSLLCSQASVVVCNGGSTTGYQALVSGKPVLGIPSNMDQYLSMSAIERAGSGILLRSDRLTVKGVKKALESLLDHQHFIYNANKCSQCFAAYNSDSLFSEVVREILQPC